MLQVFPPSIYDWQTIVSGLTKFSFETTNKLCCFHFT